MTRNRGKACLMFPESYTMIDLETTGYSPKYDRVLEVSAVKVISGRQDSTLSTLVRYPDDNSVPEYSTQLTGITEDMIITNGEGIDRAMRLFDTFLGDDLIVGYNVSFDIGFLYDTYKLLSMRDLNNNYVDVLSLARRFWPTEKHNRLADVIQRIGLEHEQVHRGLADCEDQIAVLNYIQTNADETILAPHKHTPSKKIDYKALSTEVTEFNEAHPFFGKNVCFTGALSIKRAEAAQLITDVGGKAQSSVTKQTDYLVVGDVDYIASVKNGVTGKMKKAQEYIALGQELKVIPEPVFLDFMNQE
ncbi:exonuclease domain-containing protein [Agrilactobacillus yilanensis]|uniref:Exonuclease domain-containing protein n=1 Tax=Agrilactobacillus yilanensis TaxID=2485997 RepID=A0ABW4JBS1_9LACO|nr:exonuclease domain-containing protein [Agrilactobacillus yilanensis]